MTFVFPVFLAKAPFKSRLFREPEIDAVYDPIEECQNRYPSGCKQDRLPGQDHDQAEDHGVAHIPVLTAHDQVTRWIPWHDCAPADQNEHAHGQAKKERPRQSDQSASHKAQD